MLEELEAAKLEVRNRPSKHDAGALRPVAALMRGRQQRWVVGSCHKLDRASPEAAEEKRPKCTGNGTQMLPESGAFWTGHALNLFSNFYLFKLFKSTYLSIYNIIVATLYNINTPLVFLSNIT